MQKVNLILHCGASAVSRQQVDETITPTPTATWHPIPHTALITQVESALQTANMRVVEQAHALTRDGKRYFGLMQVANCTTAGEDFSYVLGLRNSSDRSFPAGLVVGASVFVCDNMSFSGEIKIARKHTSHIMRDLLRLTIGAIGLLSEKWNTMATRIATYKTTEMSDMQAHDFVVRALDAGAVTVTQIPGILTEWRTPRHPEFSANGKTAWRLFNAVTESHKSIALHQLAPRSIRLHGLMDSQVGLVTTTNSARAVENTVDAVVEIANN